jgi:hypothetical protein
MNKNIAAYCGYIGLISFVAYRPDTAEPPTSLPERRQPRRITPGGAGEPQTGRPGIE